MTTRKWSNSRFASATANRKGRLLPSSNSESRKGWTPATLAQLGVERDADNRYVFGVVHADGASAGAVRYWDGGRKPKMRADAGMARDLWPRPEDIDAGYVVVVEGE